MPPHPARQFRGKSYHVGLKPAGPKLANFKAKAKQAIGAGCVLILLGSFVAKATTQEMRSKTQVSDPFPPKSNPFPPKCGPKPRFQTAFLQNVVQNLGFRALSSKMWSLEARKRAVPFSWPKNDENEAFLVKNYIKKFQGFKICFLKAFKKFWRRGLFSLQNLGFRPLSFKM